MNYDDHELLPLGQLNSNPIDTMSSRYPAFPCVLIFPQTFILNPLLTYKDNFQYSPNSSTATNLDQTPAPSITSQKFPKSTSIGESA